MILLDVPDPCKRLAFSTWSVLSQSNVVYWKVKWMWQVWGAAVLPMQPCPLPCTRCESFAGVWWHGSRWYMKKAGKLQCVGLGGGRRRDREQWCWFCKDGQGWICFQLPELTGCASGSAAWRELTRACYGLQGEQNQRFQLKSVETDLQSGSKNITPSTERILIMCLLTHIETYRYRIGKGSPVWK